MVGVVKLFFEEVEVQELQIVMFITILHKMADIGKGNKNIFSYHQMALRSFFKNLVKWQQDFKSLVKWQENFQKSREMATKFLKISSNGNKIFKNLVKWLAAVSNLGLLLKTNYYLSLPLIFIL